MRHRAALALAATITLSAGVAVTTTAARTADTIPPRLRPTGEFIQSRGGGVQRPLITEPIPERIARLSLPDGFAVNIFARGLGAPRMLAVGADGTVYVTRRKPGDVVALQDQDGDGRAEFRRTVVTNLPNVHGIALQEGRMFLATVRSVYVAEGKGISFGQPRQIVVGLPPGGRHPNRTLGFGPDGWLYVSVGSTCNACVEASPESAALLRIRPDGSGRETFARGLRNTIGFDWHPRPGRSGGWTTAPTGWAVTSLRRS